MSYSGAIEIYTDKIGDVTWSLLQKVSIKFDEENVDLYELTLDNYASYINQIQDDLLVGDRMTAEYLAVIKLIYGAMKIKLPEWIEHCSRGDLATAITQCIPIMPLFKDIQSVFSQIDLVESPDYASEIKTICLLAWHGFDVNEISDVKLSDFNADEGYVIDNRQEKHFLTPFEIKSILTYLKTEGYKTTNRFTRYINTSYLLRPVRQGQIKVTPYTIKNRLKKTVVKMTDKKITPVVNVRPLIINGTFYRAYTSHVSKFIFDATRRAQYERYIKDFWNN